MNRLFPKRPGPNSKARKAFEEGLKNINTATREIAQRIERLVKRRVPKGYLEDISLHFKLDTDAAISWIAKRVLVEITTGMHDQNKVPFEELGTGLLALTALLLREALLEQDPRTSILAIEEPEAFLHPPAQRTLAQVLFNDSSRKNSDSILLISTHSPVFVEEANYCNIYIIAKHKVYPPICTGDDRNEINSAFLSGHGAEMLFYENILFVEGESDYLFFYRLLRRLSKYDKTGIINSTKVVPVGGNERFAPWIRLITSYSRPTGENPFSYLILADGDSSEKIRRAAQDASIAIPPEVSDALEAVARSYTTYKTAIDRNEAPNTIQQALEAWITACSNFNASANTHRFPFRFSPGDLEYMVVEHIDDELRDFLCRVLSLGTCSNKEILRKLGSKASGSKIPNDARKQPWIRQKIGEKLTAPMMKGHIRDVMIYILNAFGMEKRKAKDLLKKL